MSFPYKNPISPSQLIGQQSLERSKTYGTNYSILSTGGYMEVFSLDQLYYTIPPSTYGPIEFSGNSIPITFSKGSGTTFSYDTLTLHPDNISSGRRKLGMLVYVYEENQLYQFLIDNYESLWTAATASTGTIVISDFGTTIKADSPENIAFMSGWTANTIDGVSGETYSTAVWKKFTIPFVDIFVTGATYSANTFTFTNNTGGTFDVSFNEVTGLTINGNLIISGNTEQIGDLNITGNTIIQSGITASSYNISTTPVQNDLLTQVLVRNSITGNIEYRDINTFGNNYTYVSGATYSALTTDNVLGVDSSISATTIYLPDSVSSGRLRYDIKDIGLNSYNNNITIQSIGSDTIISTENSNSVILQADGGALIIFNTGLGTWLQM